MATSQCTIIPINRDNLALCFESLFHSEKGFAFVVIERGCYGNGTSNLGCFVDGTSSSSFRTISCLCDTNRCNGLSVEALVCESMCCAAKRPLFAKMNLFTANCFISQLALLCVLLEESVVLSV